MEVDSLTTAAVAADSILVLPRDFDEAAHPFDATLDTALLQRLPEAVAAQQRADSIAIATAPPAWQQGLEPVARATQPGNSTGFLLVISLMALVMLINFRHLPRLVKMYLDELVNIRQGRDKVFDEHPAGDNRVMIQLVAQGIVCIGLLLTAAQCRLTGRSIDMTGSAVASVVGVVTLYYFFQLVAYNVVGYTFTSPDGRREWLRGFNASQALLGLALAIPAVLTVFYPDAISWTVWISVGVYAIMRLLFIFKGFRIFYDKIDALLYFILYLCTLEIIPLTLVYHCSHLLV